MERTHGETHYEPETCFGCKLLSVSFSQAAMPTRHPSVAVENRREGKLVKDLAAFKAMRLQGEHPKSVMGAHEVAQKAQCSFEIESGMLAETKAKGRDLANGGKEWVRRTEDAHSAVKRGEVVTAD